MLQVTGVINLDIQHEIAQPLFVVIYLEDSIRERDSEERYRKTILKETILQKITSKKVQFRKEPKFTEFGKQ